MVEPFTITPNRIIRCSHKLTHRELRVILNILSWKDQKTGQIWIYQSKLSECTGVPVRQLRYVVRKLEAKGALLAERRGQEANRYIIVDEFFDAENPGQGEQYPGHEQQYSGELAAPVTSSSSTPAKNSSTPGHPQQGTPVTSSIQEKTLRRNPEERNLEETTLSPPAAEQGGATECNARIEALSMKPTHQQFIDSWRATGSALDLAEDKIIRALEFIETKTGTLDPVAIIETAQSKNLGLKDTLILASKESCRKTSPSLGPIDELTKAIGKTKAKQNPWPTETVEQIYQAYPRRVGKAAAAKAIQSALTMIRDEGKQSDPVEFLLERTRVYAGSEAGNKGKYTPHPATWFNQLRFLDDEQEWNPTGGNRTGNIKRVIDQPPAAPSDFKHMTDEDL